MGKSGDGVASRGDNGDITGALTGRVDLLSGVDAMAGVDRERRTLKTKEPKKTYVLMWHLSPLEKNL